MAVGDSYQKNQKIMKIERLNNVVASIFKVDFKSSQSQRVNFINFIVSGKFFGSELEDQFDVVLILSRKILGKLCKSVLAQVH